MSHIHLHATPQDGLVDDPVSIGLAGLAPETPVRLRAQVLAPDNALWVSSATFVADAAGTVDLAKRAPIDGSYDDADPHGLIWSLHPEGDAPGASRTIADGLEPYSIQLIASVNGADVTQAELVRRPVAADVHQTPVRDDGLVATLFTPPGDGPFPTIIVVPGSGGGIPASLAALYASHGYASLALAYFNAGDPGQLPEELREIPLEYFEHALAYVRNHPELDTSRLVLNGTSRGGELALLLGSRYPEITAVVAWVPSGYVWAGITRDQNPNAPVYPAWTANGKPVPFVDRINPTGDDADDDGTLSFTPLFENAVAADPNRADRAEIPVENIAGPVLLITGRDDALWPSGSFSDRIVERLQERGFDFAVTHLTFEDAGHTLGTPYAPTTVTSSLHPVRKVHLRYGGTPQGIAAARADLWPQVLAFIETHVTRSHQSSRAAD